jgi:transcription initiation factor TFIID subunit TAF12
MRSCRGASFEDAESKRSIRSLRLLPFVLLIGLGATACDGNSESSENVEVATAETFAAEYTAITTQHQERVDGARTRGQDALEEGPSAVLQIYRDLLTLSEDAQADYDGLTPPAELAPEHERLVENLGRQSNALRGILEAAQTEDDIALTANLEQLADLLLEWGRTNQLIAQRLAIDG